VPPSRSPRTPVAAERPEGGDFRAASRIGSDPLERLSSSSSLSIRPRGQPSAGSRTCPGIGTATSASVFAYVDSPIYVCERRHEHICKRT